MFHPVSGTGAICHGLLPRCGGKKSCDGTCLEGFKYIDCSIKRMIKKFDALGFNRGDIQVKIFGGADMFGVRSTDARCKSVGMENVMVAKDNHREGRFAGGGVRYAGEIRDERFSFYLIPARSF